MVILSVTLVQSQPRDGNVAPAVVVQSDSMRRVRRCCTTFGRELVTFRATALSDSCGLPRTQRVFLVTSRSMSESTTNWS